MIDLAIPVGSFLSSAAEWHYFAGGLALGVVGEHWRHRWCAP